MLTVSEKNERLVEKIKAKHIAPIAMVKIQNLAIEMRDAPNLEEVEWVLDRWLTMYAPKPKRVEPIPPQWVLDLKSRRSNLN